MCGIAGVVHLSPEARPVDRLALARVLEAIQDRGPDAQGLWLDPGGRLGLANARLSTSDARPIANQPLMDLEETVVITFNGEIYNHVELRQELQQRGARFRTRSDTEVLLEAYKAYGTAMLPRLEGQFAFALYDLRRQTVMLARDPMGISPCYYTIRDGCLWFASEPRGLLQIPGFTRRLNVMGVYHYLVMESTSGGETLYEGVRSLRAGNYLRIRIGQQPVETRYAQAWFTEAPGEPRSPEAWAAQLRALLRDAVARRMVADKEVGLFLSGGLDSTILLAVMRELNPATPVRAFSVGFEEIETKEIVGELPFAREASRLFGATQEEIIVRHEHLVDRMANFELPTPSIIDILCDVLAERAVRSGVEVVLTGEGSDEMFLGYDHYFAAIGRLEPRHRHLADRFPIRGAHPGAQDPRALVDLFLGIGVDLRLEADRHQLCGEALADAPSVRSIVEGYLKELAAIHPHAELDKQILYIELAHKMPEVFIRRAERPCMGHGVEVRLPFLDLRVVNAHFTMPMAVRLDGEELKGLLRKCVADLLPPQMRDRPKMPFGLPAQTSRAYHSSTHAFPRPAFAQLFRVHAPRLEAVLAEGSLVRDGILNKAYIRARLEPQRNPKTAHFDPLLWKLWSLAEWHERWIRGGHVRRAPSLRLAGAGVV